MKRECQAYLPTTVYPKSSWALPPAFFTETLAEFILFHDLATCILSINTAWQRMSVLASRYQLNRHTCGPCAMCSRLLHSSLTADRAWRPSVLRFRTFDRAGRLNGCGNEIFVRRTGSDEKVPLDPCQLKAVELSDTLWNLHFSGRCDLTFLRDLTISGWEHLDDSASLPYRRKLKQQEEKAGEDGDPLAFLSRPIKPFDLPTLSKLTRLVIHSCTTSEAWDSFDLKRLCHHGVNLVELELRIVFKPPADPQEPEDTGKWAHFCSLRYLSYQPLGAHYCKQLISANSDVGLYSFELNLLNMTLSSVQMRAAVKRVRDVWTETGSLKEIGVYCNRVFADDLLVELTLQSRQGATLKFTESLFLIQNRPTWQKLNQLHPSLHTFSVQVDLGTVSDGRDLFTGSRPLPLCFSSLRVLELYLKDNDNVTLISRNQAAVRLASSLSLLPHLSKCSLDFSNANWNDVSIDAALELLHALRGVTYLGFHNDVDKQCCVSLPFIQAMCRLERHPAPAWRHLDWTGMKSFTVLAFVHLLEELKKGQHGVLANLKQLTLTNTSMTATDVAVFEMVRDPSRFWPTILLDSEYSGESDEDEDED